MNTEWHWIKDNDYPEENNKEVWCVYKNYGSSRSCGAKSLTYIEDLYKFDDYIFEQYKGAHQHGFFTFDSEYGWVNYTEDVICWCYLPEIPDEWCLFF